MISSSIRLATLPTSHPLHKPVNQVALRFVKRHHSPLHELMHRFKLKPQHMEKLAASRQGPKWEPDLAIRIAGSKEVAKVKDLADKTMIKVYTDGSGFEGSIGAAAVLYRNGALKSRRRMLLGSVKNHTVYKGEGVEMILGLELIREEREVDGIVSMGTDNTAAIIATHAIKPGPSHHIWDLFHKRLGMVRNRHLFRETVMHFVLHCTAHVEARQTMFNAAGRDARNLGKLLSTLELLPHLFQFIRSTDRLRLSRKRNMEA